ncbi:MAG: PH domain-containing protein [Elusimicrobiota bacterium]|jgi:hypothetical protein|nr:PH domain-containing protein [Elusimicrobiota bacterium]
MGFLQGLMGNANTTSIEEVKKEWGSLLAKDEVIGAAYKLIRDYIIFTDKRLIVIDIQGFTGTKIEVKSIPYAHIIAFSVTTAGVLDFNAELSIWFSASKDPIEKKFNKNVNIYEVQGILADAIAASTNKNNGNS